jgi:hypothetical protein
MAHAQKPDFVFRRNGRVHLNRRGLQFSRLLAAEVCASAGCTMFRGSVKRNWPPTPFASFPLTSSPVHHRVPSHFNWTLHTYKKGLWVKAKRNKPLWCSRLRYEPHLSSFSRPSNFHSSSQTINVLSMISFILQASCHNLFTYTT